MRILTFNDKEEIRKILQKDEVIAFPTETVFGLGVLSSSEKAFNKLVLVKERKPDKPFTLMMGDKLQIEKYAKVDTKTKRIIDKFMPGSLTILIEPVEGLKPYLTLNSDSIGIRIPDSNELLDLLNYIGEPLLVPSANKADLPPALSNEEVIQAFNGEVSALIEGKITSGKPSTIVKINKHGIILIREGNLPFELIRKEYEND